MHDNRPGERGVAAIEFAIVLPLLLLLVVGMIEFSRAWSAQASLSGAARAAARSYAIHNNADTAIAEAVNNGLNLNLTADNIDIQPAAGCTTGLTATVTITYRMDYLTGLFGDNLTLTGKGMYPCQG